MQPDARIIAQDGDDILYVSSQDPRPEDGWVKVSGSQWRREMSTDATAGIAVAVGEA